MTDINKNLHKRYFHHLRQSIENRIPDVHLLTKYEKNNPLEYTYVHNLIDGKIEDVTGTDCILGYQKNEFTLDLLYSIIHPDDYEAVYETTRKGFKYLYEEKESHIFKTYLIITHRLKKSNGEYAHILRRTSVLKTANDIPTHTYSISVDITPLNLRPFVSIKYYSCSNFCFDSKEITHPKGYGYLTELTYCESRILQLISEGKKSKEVAQVLGTSIKTIHTHRRNILKKTGLSSMLEVICKAQEHPIQHIPRIGE